MTDTAQAETDLVIRPYRDVDEPEVLELLRSSLGGGPAGQRSPEYFRWKHLENPFGRSYMIVAESGGGIIGFRALLRWRFQVKDRTIEAVRPVDTVTHHDYRGRGVFSRLTSRALEDLRGQVDLVFNTPNQDSLPGYLKLGWQVVMRVRASVRICRPALGKLLRGRLQGSPPPEPPRMSAPTAAEILSDEPQVARLIELSEVTPWTYSTPVTVEYLRWRYGSAPLLGYHAVREERHGELAGLAFFRTRAEGSLWGIVVGQLIVHPGDVRTARRLLTQVRRSADVGYVASFFPRGSTAARARLGTPTIRAPRTLTFVVNLLRADLDPDPRDFSSWGLSAGDVEVF